MSDNTPCESIREEFSALLDGELTADEQARIDEHLLGCSECLRSLDAMKKVMGLYDELPRVEAPEDVLDGVHEALDDTTVEFERANDGNQRVSYRPVLIAAATLALMAGVSYIAVEGLDSQRQYAAEAPEASMEADVAMVEESIASEATVMRDAAVQQVKEKTAGELESKDKHGHGHSHEGHSHGEESGTPQSPMLKAKPKLIFSDEEVEIPGADIRVVTPEIEEYRKNLKEKVYSAYTIREDGLWIEKGYTDQALTTLKPGTDDYVIMLGEKEYLSALTRHTRDIIFSYEGQWYRIAHIGPLISDIVLGEPHPNSRKKPTDPVPQP